jgi:hypothetical protein
MQEEAEIRGTCRYFMRISVYSQRFSRYTDDSGDGGTGKEKEMEENPGDASTG